MDQNPGLINYKKGIYSTGFYSPPVMKIKVYKYCQLPMESFAAESRRFGIRKWPKITEILPYFDRFGRQRARSDQHADRSVSK